MAVALTVASLGTDARAQDRQIVQRGRGLANTLCVVRGFNGVRDSNAGGDDVVVAQDIQSGPNGICESLPNSLNPGGDDVHDVDITFGNGARHKVAISPQSDNICRSPVTLKGDDVRRVADPTTFTPIGSSIARRVGIRPEPGTTIESVPGDDDVATAVICPGGDATIESTPTGGDALAVGDARCDVCPTGAACIVPDTSDVLHTTPAGTDERREYVSTGLDGICDTIAAATDLQLVETGEGSENTICVDSGPDGIVQTLLCGNGVVDLDENGILFDTECEDGNDVSGDGCSDVCAPEGCGDGVVQPALGEECEDLNLNPNDTCIACHDAVCGDGFECSAGACTTGPTGGPEQCDDGNAVTNDGCTPTCAAEVCGDGVVQSGIGEQCEDGNAVDTDPCANCRDAVCGDGFVCSHAACTSGPGGGPEPCDDGNADNNDACVLGCMTANCGDGYVRQGVEECDPPDATCVSGLVGQACGDHSDCDTAPDAGDGECVGCTTGCLELAPPSCGDGVVQPGFGEECEDQNSSNKDACTTDCRFAVCGDGYTHSLQGGTEECDDGNVQSGDGCNSSCRRECGNGRIDGACSQGDVGADCAVNADCDTAPASGDGVCVGETCDVGCGEAVVGATCTSGSVGGQCTVNADCNTGPPDGVCSGSVCGPGCTQGLIDGTCVAGAIASACAQNSDCDTGPADGICSGHTCGPAGNDALFCVAAPDVCSDKCRAAECGNMLLECDEECDSGPANGVGASGCSTDCRRTFIGGGETHKSNECPIAWSLANAPEPVTRKTQRCTDNAAACDAGTIVGECEFRVGLCLNRSGVPGCTPGELVAIDLRGLKVDRDATAAAAAEDITEALAGLGTPETAAVPGRCRSGLKRKSCSVGADYECDTTFGAGNGKCNIGTGVLFAPPFSALDACTDEVAVVVPAGEKLTLRAGALGVVGRDADVLRLVCR